MPIDDELDIKKESEFIQACYAGNLQVVESLIATNPALVNVPATNGSYPLMFAAEGGHGSIVTCLINNKASIDAVPESGDFKGTTVLWCAASHEKWDIVELLLKAGAKSFDVRPETDDFPILTLAVYAKQKNILEALIKAGADLEAVPESGENKGCTALWVAGGAQQWDIAKLLLEAGAKNLDSTSTYAHNEGKTLLWFAARDEEWDIVRILLNAGIKNFDPSAPASSSAYRGITPLWFAAYFEQCNIVEALLNAGAKNLDAALLESDPILTELEAIAKYKGMTALGIAISLKRWDIVRILQKAGAKKIDVASKPGFCKDKTVLWLAAADKQWDIVLDLMPAAAANKSLDFAAEDKTVLSFAKSEGAFDTVKELFVFGASIDPPHIVDRISAQYVLFDPEKHSQPQYLKTQRLLEVVACLFKLAEKSCVKKDFDDILPLVGPALNGRHQGKTILQVAVQNKSVVLAEELLMRDADVTGILLGESSMTDAFLKLESLNQKISRLITGDAKTNTLHAEEPPKKDRQDIESKETKEGEEAKNNAEIEGPIEALAQELLTLAVKLEDPLKNVVCFKLGKLLYDNFSYVRSSLSILQSALESVTCHDVSRFAGAKGMLIELKLAGIIEDESLEESSENKIKQVLAAGSSIQMSMLSGIVLGEVLGPEYSLGRLGDLSSSTRDHCLQKIFCFMKQEIDLLKSQVPAEKKSTAASAAMNTLVQFQSSSVSFSSASSKRKSVIASESPEAKKQAL